MESCDVVRAYIWNEGKQLTRMKGRNILQTITNRNNRYIHTTRMRTQNRSFHTSLPNELIYLFVIFRPDRFQLKAHEAVFNACSFLIRIFWSRVALCRPMVRSPALTCALLLWCEFVSCEWQMYVTKPDSGATTPSICFLYEGEISKKELHFSQLLFQPQDYGLCRFQLRTRLRSDPLSAVKRMRPQMRAARKR